MSDRRSKYRIATNGHSFMPQFRVLWWWMNLCHFGYVTRDEAQAAIDCQIRRDQFEKGPWLEMSRSPIDPSNPRHSLNTIQKGE